MFLSFIRGMKGYDYFAWPCSLLDIKGCLKVQENSKKLLSLFFLFSLSSIESLFVNKIKLETNPKIPTTKVVPTYVSKISCKL
jgi:hypothetical protein